eukprot:Hpha_TRINITY_DN22332_c0_g1::TRINITY_DN22332_c0_g1_i1::g.177766::m.177766
MAVGKAGRQSGWGLLVALVVGLLTTPTEAAGGVSIFKLGSQIDEKHWDILWMYFTTFGLTMILEHVVHQLHVKVTTSTGTAVVHHVVQEVMILGAISAILVVFENLGGGELIDAALFHYVHFVIFLMMVIFITLVTMLFSTVGPAWTAWERFEERVMEIAADPALQNEERIAFLIAFINTVSHGHRKLACLCFFRQSLPSRFLDINFSRYMKKMERKVLLNFLHLSYSSWGALVVLCGLVAITDWITIMNSDNEVATIALWVLFVGFGPLILLTIMAAKVRREFQRFAVSVQEMRQHQTFQAPPQKEYFWLGKPDWSVFLIQAMLLYQVFYLATVTVNFSWRLWKFGKEHYGGSHGLGFILLCYFPAGVSFFIMIPLILPNFTVLYAQGDFLDHVVLLGMLQDDQLSGKFRRRRKRDRDIIAIADALQMDGSSTLLRFRSQFGGGGRKTEKSADQEEEEGEGQSIGQMMCSETIHRTKMVPVLDAAEGQPKEREVLATSPPLFLPCTKPATVKCALCGYLCNDHDMDYHRLRLCRDHERSLLDEDAASDSQSMVQSFSLKRPQRKTPAENPLGFGDRWPRSQRGEEPEGSVPEVGLEGLDAPLLALPLNPAPLAARDTRVPVPEGGGVGVDPAEWTARRDSGGRLGQRPSLLVDRKPSETFGKRATVPIGRKDSRKDSGLAAKYPGDRKSLNLSRTSMDAPAQKPWIPQPNRFAYAPGIGNRRH